MFGISRQQATGQRLVTLVPGLEALADLVSRAINGERSFGRDFSLTLPKRDYQVVELTCRIAPAGGGHGQALVEFVDATQSRQFDREKTLINQRIASKRIIRNNSRTRYVIRLAGLRGAAQLLERRARRNPSCA